MCLYVRWLVCVFVCEVVSMCFFSYLMFVNWYIV